jgi:RNA polymerase sigma factor (sigma-70 family)
MSGLSSDRDALISRRKEELISSVEDPAFRRQVYQRAYLLCKEKRDAEDDAQDAIARFISAVKNKKSLQEIEHMNPLSYIAAILKNINIDRQRKTHGSRPQEDTSEKLGRQKLLLAAQLGMAIEDIANYQQEDGRLASTELGVEDQVISEIVVEAFIEGLPEDLRELVKLLMEGYQVKEVAGMLKLSVWRLRRQINRLQKALEDEKNKAKETM